MKYLAKDHTWLVKAAYRTEGEKQCGNVLSGTARNKTMPNTAQRAKRHTQSCPPCPVTGSDSESNGPLPSELQNLHPPRAKAMHIAYCRQTRQSSRAPSVLGKIKQNKALNFILTIIIHRHSLYSTRSAVLDQHTTMLFTIYTVNTQKGEGLHCTPRAPN